MLTRSILYYIFRGSGAVRVVLQCLCLAPTYELAKQIGAVVTKMAEFLPAVAVRFAVRGQRRVGRYDRIQEQIVIGTPGTCLDWLLKFRVFDPKLLRVFVLDEADVMISQQGHQDQSIRIREYAAISPSLSVPHLSQFVFSFSTLSETCQLLFFSATYDEEVMEFADRIVPNALLITYGTASACTSRPYAVPSASAHFDA